MPTPSTEPTPTHAEKLLRSPAFIGTCLGAVVAVLLGIVFAVDVHPEIDRFIGSFLLMPAIVGSVFGAIVGWAVGVTRRRDAVLFASVVAWVLVGAFVAVFTPALVGLLYGWATGIGSSGFPLRGRGPAVTPFGLKAMTNALDHVILFAAFFAIPVGAVGAVIGSIIAGVSWRNRNVQAPPNELDRKDFT